MNRRSLLKTLGVAGMSTIVFPTLGSNPATTTRTVEVYDHGSWVPGSWGSLKVDDIFRLREADGTLVDAGTEDEVCVAMSEAKIDPATGYYKIVAESFTFIGLEHPLASRTMAFKKGAQVGRLVHLDMRTHLATGMDGDEIPFDYISII